MSTRPKRLWIVLFLAILNIGLYGSMDVINELRLL